MAVRLFMKKGNRNKRQDGSNPPSLFLSNTPRTIFKDTSVLNSWSHDAVSRLFISYAPTHSGRCVFRLCNISAPLLWPAPPSSCCFRCPPSWYLHLTDWLTPDLAPLLLKRFFVPFSVVPVLLVLSFYYYIIIVLIIITNVAVVGWLFCQSAKLEFCTLPHKHVEEKIKIKKGRGSEDNKTFSRDIDQDLIIYPCIQPLVVLQGACWETCGLRHLVICMFQLHISITKYGWSYCQYMIFASFEIPSTQNVEQVIWKYKTRFKKKKRIKK